MEHIQVRGASTADLGTLQRIGRDTFYETFAESNNKEDMEKYLEGSFNDAKISAELSNPESLFFIAWDGEKPVGYLKLNTGAAQTEPLKKAIEIERIYVKRTHQGKKVGQLLYEKALEIAHQNQNSFSWLGVWEKNPRAIRFYEKNGFIKFDKHMFKMGNDEQVDLMMKKELLPPH